MLLQTMAFREIVSVRYSEYKSVDGAGRLPLFRTLQWGWYYVALVFVYGDFIKEFAYSHERGQDVLLHYARHHEALAFAGYCLVFMLSVWTLTADNVKYQVGQLSWTIVTLCIVVGQMKFVAHNIFDGLFWFFFPAWLVINNDCWAYAWGAGQDKGDSTSLQRECSARARSGKSIHASRPFREMIARPKIS